MPHDLLHAPGAQGARPPGHGNAAPTASPRRRSAAGQRLLQQDVLQSTALALKEHFVLQKIAEVEKIDVDEDDIDDEIERIADQNDESPRRVRARLEKEDLIEALAAEIIERKALDLILEQRRVRGRAAATRTEAPTVATVEEQAVPGEMTGPDGAAAARRSQKAETAARADKAETLAHLAPRHRRARAGPLRRKRRD